MGARQKLNGFYLYGALFFAMIAGGCSGSMWVFMITLAVLVVFGVSEGDIRLGGSRRRRW